MRSYLFAIAVSAFALGAAQGASAESPHASTRVATEPKPWCAPEVSELSDHVCFSDGGTPANGRRTLVVYLHGLLATTPGFQWLQQRAMAIHAKRLGFVALLPTSPKMANAYVWPTSQKAQEQQEAEIVAGIQKARADLEQRLGHGFDEVFVVGFSSGAYYGSSLALRGVLDVDGYIILVGGASWARSQTTTTKRAPVFVGISAADAQTANHSRSFAATLASMGWPYRAEERNVGHMVDWGFMTRGIQWLRSRTVH